MAHGYHMGWYNSEWFSRTLSRRSPHPGTCISEVPTALLGHSFPERGVPRPPATPPLHTETMLWVSETLTRIPAPTAQVHFQGRLGLPSPGPHPLPCSPHPLPLGMHISVSDKLEDGEDMWRNFSQKAIKVLAGY